MNRNDNNSPREFNFYNLYLLIRLNLKFIIIFIISGLAIVTAYSYIIPEEYQATATLIPPEESGRGGLSDYLQTLSGGISLGGAAGQSNKLQLVADYLQSREVAKSIADSLDLYNNPFFRTEIRENLYKNIISCIEITIKKSGLILINTSVNTGYFPGRSEKKQAAILSAKIANAAIDGLDKLNRSKSVSKAKRKRIFIEKILAEKKQALDSVDLALEAFQSRNKVLALDNQTEAIVGNAVSIGSELGKAEIELGLKQQEYDKQSPVIKTLQDKVNNLRSQYQRSQRGGLVTDDEISIPLTKVPELIRVYTNLMRDQKILEQVNLYLETQKYQEAIQEESDVATVEALDRAQPPAKRHTPDRKLMLILGLMLSSIFAVSIVVFKALNKGRMYFKRSSAGEAQTLSKQLS